MVAAKRKKSASAAEKPGVQPLDGPTLMLVIFLLAIGIVMLFSASYTIAYYNPNISTPLYYVIRQGAYMAVGLVVMWWVSRVDYHRWHKWSVPLFVVGLVLLVLVLTPLGTEVNNAQRWLFGFQPSEVMKTGVIFLFSSLASVYHDKIKTFRYGLLPYVCLLAIIALLLVQEPHLSATIITVGTGMVILFVAGIRLWYFIPLIPLGTVGVIVFLRVNEYAMTRIRIWLDPFLDRLGDGYQAVQSFIAIGSGGLWGLGLGNSRQKHLYLPEPANDFIFSVACEELGFIGAMVIIILFAALVCRGYYIAMRSRDKFGCLLATGITTKIAIQTLVNMCVVTGLMPVTGAALPFFSYGGTALLIQLFEVGVLLNISRQMTAPKAG